jgi:hypothetical protein
MITATLPIEREAYMRNMTAILCALIFAASQAYGADGEWYAGDERCPPPPDDGTYSAPYNALDHPRDYPTFDGADKPGWSCSYQREDGVIIQYGNSMTPQQQWQAVWSGGGDSEK